MQITFVSCTPWPHRPQKHQHPRAQKYVLQQGGHSSSTRSALGRLLLLFLASTQSGISQQTEGRDRLQGHLSSSRSTASRQTLLPQHRTDRSLMLIILESLVLQHLARQGLQLTGPRMGAALLPAAVVATPLQGAKVASRLACQCCLGIVQMPHQCRLCCILHVYQKAAPQPTQT